MTENPGTANHDDALDRLLRETTAGGYLAEFKDDLHRQTEELFADAQDRDLVGMEPLIAYFNANDVTTTYYSGGSAFDGRIVSRPHIMFPHLDQIEEAMRLFEILARHLGDDDMVQAIYNPTSEGEVGKGERLLHDEQGGFRTSGGRIVSFDNTWAVEIGAVEYETNWVASLRNFDLPVPDRRPVGDHAWRFSVYLPPRHAEALTRAAREITNER